MAVAHSRKNFSESEEGRAVKEKLEQMAVSELFNSPSSYSANSAVYTDNKIPFVDKHMEYLIKHPAIEPDQYLSNLRLMTRVR